MKIVRKRIRLRGRVQGVGFRWFTSSVGRNLGLLGWVRNESDGAVLVEVQGEEGAVAQFLQQVQRGPSSARVVECAVEDLTPDGGLAEFGIER